MYAMTTLSRSAGILAFLLLFQNGSAQATPATQRPLVEVNTTLGRLVIALFNETPLHRDNFLRAVQEHRYDSTLIHRVVPGLLLQGGDLHSRKVSQEDVLLGTASGGTLPGEQNPRLHHFKGALSAVPAMDTTAAPGSTDMDQFFFALGDAWTAEDLARFSSRPDAAVWFTPEAIETYGKRGGCPHMDGSYTVFGEVIEGLEVLDAISDQPCDQRDRPLTDVRLWMRNLP